MPSPDPPETKARAAEYPITLEHPLELEDAPDFVSWPPQVSLEQMMQLADAELKRRATAGIPVPRSQPVATEFVL